jgi:hypothetical protein
MESDELAYLWWLSNAPLFMLGEYKSTLLIPI